MSPEKKDALSAPMSSDNPGWWLSSCIYQIYPRSFQDSNGDGIGDLVGIISRLDYLERLGIDLIWLSPVFSSPMHDNGYDISDYHNIAPEFGTLADFELLISEASDRRIGVLLDLVVNHTSDQHAWFVDSRSSLDAQFRNFYIWRDSRPDGSPPSDLQSVFGGSAWTHDPTTDQYYLHQFSTHQPDLNWENPALRAAIYEMMNWWIAKGIAGFRMDVIDLIGKDIDRDITANGPHLHKYLQEMNRSSFGSKNMVTIGEAWSATPESAKLYSGRNRHELSMVFQFEHVTKFWDEKYGKWQPKPNDFLAFKTVLNKWQTELAHDGWNSLFWGNHDLPRAVSKYGDDKRYRVQSAKMLASVLHLMKGTPFVYQGEELGMTNVTHSSIDQFRDVETLNFYEVCVQGGMSASDFIAGANINGRDNARTPMQWSNTAQAGFTTGTPWIDVNPNYTAINAAACISDETSVWSHYQKLIAIRKSHPIVVHGLFQSFLDDHPTCLAYTRTLGGSCLAVIANFAGEHSQIEVPKELQISGCNLITNYTPAAIFGTALDLAPFEVQAIYRKGEDT